MVILGIDLRASAKRSSSVVGLDCDSQVCFMDSFDTDDEFVALAEKHQPQLISIGAPLGLPAGLCCLESSCSCNFAVPHRKGRQQEIELSKMGISCFFTNKGSIIRQLIYRGVSLNQQLSKLGHQVIEVYPHASKVILFGDKLPPKNSSGSLGFMKDHLTPLVQGLDPHLDGMDRNTCDALLNAYTGLLHAKDETDILGDPDEGLLVLPKLPC